MDPGHDVKQRSDASSNAVKQRSDASPNTDSAAAAIARFLVAAVYGGARPADGSADGAVLSDIVTVLGGRSWSDDIAGTLTTARTRLTGADVSQDDLLDEALQWTIRLRAALREDLGLRPDVPSPAPADLVTIAETDAWLRACMPSAPRDRRPSSSHRHNTSGPASAPVRPVEVDRATRPAAPTRHAVRRRHPERASTGAMFRGGPARTGDYGSGDSAQAGPFDWAYSTGGAVRSSPVVVDGVVYVGSAAGGVHAVDAATGAHIWTRPTGGGVDAAVAVAGGVAYVTSTDGVIHALDAADGRPRWAGDARALGASSPAVAEGLVVVGGPDATLLALDASTGEVRWVCDTRTGRAADHDTMALESSPAICDGVVYVNSAHLLAVEVSTGDVRWMADVATPPTTSPAVAGGGVYTADLRGAVCAVDGRTGAVRWRSAPTGALFAFSTVAAVSELVIACGQSDVLAGSADHGGDGGVVFAFDAATGTERWRYRSREPIVSTPAVAEGSVTVVEIGTGVHVVGLAAHSGQVRQRRRLSAASVPTMFASSPALAGRTLYVGLPDGHLIARPTHGSGRVGFRRRVAAWWGRERADDHLPAVAGSRQPAAAARSSSASAADDPAAADDMASAGQTTMAARRYVQLQQLAHQCASTAQTATTRGDADDAVRWATRAIDAIVALCAAPARGDADHTAALVEQLCTRAAALEHVGDAERAVADARRAVALCDDAPSGAPGSFDVAIALDARRRLMMALAAAGDADEARGVGSAVLSELRALATRHPAHEPKLMRALAEYSAAMVTIGDTERALEAGRDALASYRQRSDGLGLHETLVFGRVALVVAKLLSPATADTFGEGAMAADDAVRHLETVARTATSDVVAGMGDVLADARATAHRFATSS